MASIQAPAQTKAAAPVQPVQEPPKRERVEAKREPEQTKVEPAVRVEVSEAGKSAASGRPPPKTVEHEVAQKKSEHAQAAQASGKRGASSGGAQSLM
ncbi:MAG: hypothetical protein RL539_1662 [Pseudomonadota bacterium]|jgi:hypothetical protein